VLAGCGQVRESGDEAVPGSYDGRRDFTRHAWLPP
jgi:hypothetical protein